KYNKSAPASGVMIPRRFPRRRVATETAVPTGRTRAGSIISTAENLRLLFRKYAAVCAKICARAARRAIAHLSCSRATAGSLTGSEELVNLRCRTCASRVRIVAVLSLLMAFAGASGCSDYNSIQPRGEQETLANVTQLTRGFKRAGEA